MLVREQCSTGDPQPKPPSKRTGMRGRLPQRHSWNFKWFTESHKQNALPIPSRWLLERLGTCGWEENAAHSRARFQHPWITQGRKAQQVPTRDAAAGLSWSWRWAVKEAGKVLPCRCLDGSPRLPLAPWAGLWKPFLPPVWQLNAPLGWSDSGPYL